MEIAVFAKRGKTREGRSFVRYLTTLTKRDGTAQTVAVKFRDGAGEPKPEACPMNIQIERGSANLSARSYVDPQTGELRESKTLWVTNWTPGAPYVDHSLDDYDV